MLSETLSFLNSTLINCCAINYQFMRWNGKIKNPYFIGEVSEMDGGNEDGMRISIFTLSGFSTGSWAELLEAKERIINTLCRIATVLPCGVGVAISYTNTITIPSDGDNPDIKRIQMEFEVHEWRNKNYVR